MKKLQRGVVPPPPPPPCLRDLSLLVGLTCDTTLQPLDPGSPCRPASLLSPSCVNNIAFVTFKFRGVEGWGGVSSGRLLVCPCQRSPPICFLASFCFPSSDEKSCPFSFNKQTAVQINNLQVPGLWPGEISVTPSFYPRWQRPVSSVVSAHQHSSFVTLIVTCRMFNFATLRFSYE